MITNMAISRKKSLYIIQFQQLILVTFTWTFGERKKFIKIMFPSYLCKLFNKTHMGDRISLLN